MGKANHDEEGKNEVREKGKEEGLKEKKQRSPVVCRVRKEDQKNQGRPPTVLCTSVKASVQVRAQWIHHPS